MLTAIIQARMDSTRLPGKVMKKILGRPILWYLINRLQQAQLIDKIIIATTDKENDSPILELAKSLGLDSYAGSENDVLDRYYQTAKKYGAETIARITADCPLIDPALVDNVIRQYLENTDNLDYVQSGISYPDGIVETSVFSFALLEKAWREAKLPSEREHVTPYFWKNPHLFRVLTIENNEDLSDMRLTVDDDADFQLVSELFRNLYREGEIFHMGEILDLLKERPDLLKLNEQTVRNEGYLESLKRDTKES